MEKSKFPVLDTRKAELELSLWRSSNDQYTNVPETDIFENVGDFSSVGDRHALHFMSKFCIYNWRTFIISKYVNTNNTNWKQEFRGKLNIVFVTSGKVLY